MIMLISSDNRRLLIEDKLIPKIKFIENAPDEDGELCVPLQYDLMKSVIDTLKIEDVNLKKEKMAALINEYVQDAVTAIEFLMVDELILIAKALIVSTLKSLVRSSKRQTRKTRSIV